MPRAARRVVRSVVRYHVLSWSASRATFVVLFDDLASPRPSFGLVFPVAFQNQFVFRVAAFRATLSIPFNLACKCRLNTSPRLKEAPASPVSPGPGPISAPNPREPVSPGVSTAADREKRGILRGRGERAEFPSRGISISVHRYRFLSRARLSTFGFLRKSRRGSVSSATVTADANFLQTGLSLLPAFGKLRERSRNYPAGIGNSLRFRFPPAEVHHDHGIIKKRSL